MIKEENINCTIEALILASPDPVSVKKLSETLDNIPASRARQAIDDLNNIYMGCGNSFRIREVAGGYQVHILPDFEQPIRKLLVKERTVRLSRPALETLAIIAYKQPVTKIDIEHIRGVATDGVIHNLMQRQLIVISGRAESAGRPLLYRTSNEFLKFFGLNRLSDLPRMDEIEEMIRMAESPKEQTMLPLTDAQEKSATLGLSDFMPEPGEDMSDDELIATADIDELMNDLDIPEEDENESPHIPSGGNGSGDDEDLVGISETEMAQMMATETESEMIPELEQDFDEAESQEDDSWVEPIADEAEFEPESPEDLPVEPQERKLASEESSSRSTEPLHAVDSDGDIDPDDQD